MPITQYNKAISLKLEPKLNYPANELGSRIQIYQSPITKTWTKIKLPRKWNWV